MRPRIPLRARMALIWGVGFFVLGVVMLATVGYLIRQTIDDTPDAVTNSIVTELGLDVEQLDELVVADPSGTAVSASEIAPLSAGPDCGGTNPHHHDPGTRSPIPRRRSGRCRMVARRAGDVAHWLL